MYLWNHYGMTSYNLGNSVEPMSVTYWEIQMAMDYCKPKVIVLDVYSCDDKYFVAINCNNNQILEAIGDEEIADGTWLSGISYKKDECMKPYVFYGDSQKLLEYGGDEEPDI